MNAQHTKLVILLMVLLIMPTVATAQSAVIPVEIPVNGRFVFAGNQTGTAQTSASTQLLMVETSTGDVELITSNERFVQAPIWSFDGDAIAFMSADTMTIYRLSMDEEMAVSSERLPQPESWSSNNSRILYLEYDYNVIPVVQSLNIWALDEANSSTVLSYQEDELIVGLPVPSLPPGVTQLTFRGILQADWNPVYPDWMVIQITGYSPEITLTEQGEGSEFLVTFIYDLQTGQMLSLDALFDNPISVNRISWSPDGRFLLLQTDEVIPGKTHIVAFEHDGQDWTLSDVDGASSEFQTALHWLGVGDLILSGGIDSNTNDRVRYIAQIINGEWHYTEFFRLPASMFDRFGSSDWQITASEEEKHELSCLFDQAQPTRFGVGERARVNFTTGILLRLREAPDLDAVEIMQMPEGTEFDVIGGPACVNASDYYRFWQIELDDSTTGWAVEAGMTDYFMEPVPDVVLTAAAGLDQTVTAAQETWYYMLRWSADGELLAVATSSGVEIYDETLSLVQTINPGSNRVTSIDWHPEGTQLAVTHGGVEIWTRGADNLLTFSERLEISGATLGVFWNADGSRLAAFNGADTRESPESERLFPGHRATVVIWNTETWQVVVETTEQYLIPDFQGIYEFDWHPNDPHIFVVAGAQTYIDSAGNRATTPLSAFIINSEMGNVEYMINDIVKIDVYGVTWHPDGNHFSLSGQSSVGTFTVPSGELIDGYFVAEARNLQWRSDGAYLLADSGLFAAGNPDILVWIPDTVPDTVTTWHPINDTITVIIDGVPTAYDLTTIPGYIPLAISPATGVDETMTGNE